ncbi:MAG: polysaccharide biosynthesis/export family protein [Pseudomonadota bacterium]
MAILSACASELPQFESAPIQDLSPNLVSEPAAIRTGDLVEVSYFENLQGSRGPYRLNRGDILSFNLVGEPDTQANSILVQDDGFASFPIVGQVRTVGLTMKELDEELKERFVEKLYSDPLLNLTLASAFSVSQAELSSLSNSGRSNGFTVTVPQNGRISLAQLGSFNALTSPASLESSIKSRLNNKFGARYSASVNVIERAPRTIFVTGAVVEPGEVPVTGPMSTLHAVASAGGFADTAAPRSVAVIRYDSHGNTTSWIVDLRKTLIEGGKDATPLLLKPRDIVYVPRSNVALTNAIVQQYVLNNLPFGVGVGYTLN